MQTIIDGNGTHRVFQQGSLSTSTISGVTIQNGAALTGSDTNGGGIINLGNLSVINCIISGNKASSLGGGVYNAGVSLTVVTSVIYGNSIIGRGGEGSGIFNHGTLQLTDSTVSGNTGNSAVSNGLDS